MMWIKTITFTLILMCLCAFCFVNKTVDQNKALIMHAKRPKITVWVPGTRLAPKFMFKSFFFRLPGLRKAEEYELTFHKRQMAELMSKNAPKEYPFEHFYYFGWEGKLCFSQRKQAAQELYDEIRDLIKKHTNILGIPPHIRIIAHSHGGNVALNLAKIQHKNKPIQIDELILLACPVQDKTKKYVSFDCFKKVYAFYSAGDMFQVLDPQGWYKKSKANRTFSERCFEHHNKLRQARIKMNGKPIMHIDFLLERFLTQLPNLCKAIDQYYDEIIPSQIHRPKQLDIHDKTDPIEIHKKLF